MHDLISVPIDAFSSGQISSKMWLCEKLEKICDDLPQKIWIYGGWTGVLSLLLLSRSNIKIDMIRSFDVDEKCEKIADTLLENWVWQNWKFKAVTIDCNDINIHNQTYGPLPTIVINTSSEHFKRKDWYNNIPTGTMVVIQGNNMPNHDHHESFDSLEDFSEAYPLDVKYQGSLDFEYPSWKFTRYMIIGKKP